MALLVDGKKNRVSTATIITACTEITGDLKGSDTVHIDGVFNGNIVADNMVIVGKSGIVNGQIESKSVIINGIVRGNITCSSLEIMSSGEVSSQTYTTKATSSGNTRSEILAKNSISILKNGIVKIDLLRSEKVIINGSIESKIIATELLEVGRYGFIQGDIVIKSIKAQEGSKIVGSISIYEDKISD